MNSFLTIAIFSRPRTICFWLLS